MEKKFVVPAMSFIAAFVIWVLFFVLHLAFPEVRELSPGVAVAISLIVCGLVLFSGMRCIQVGGPRLGGIVRSCVLLVFALLTFWKIGIAAAGVLLAGALVLGKRTFIAKYEPEVAGRE